MRSQASHTSLVPSKPCWFLKGVSYAKPLSFPSHTSFVVSFIRSLLAFCGPYLLGTFNGYNKLLFFPSQYLLGRATTQWPFPCKRKDTTRIGRETTQCPFFSCAQEGLLQAPSYYYSKKRKWLRIKDTTREEGPLAKLLFFPSHRLYFIF